MNQTDTLIITHRTPEQQMLPSLLRIVFGLIFQMTANQQLVITFELKPITENAPLWERWYQSNEST